LVPVADVKKNSEHLQLVEDWLRSYRPEEFFDEHGAPQADILAYCPQGDRRMGCNPHAFGGRPRRSLYCPPLAECAVEILAKYLAKVIVQNPSIFRIFSPDKLMSN
jgi:xylulose-5-phosphate/fructose-6-phosphate phosphoketolase